MNAWCLILDTHYLIPNTWYLVLDTCCLIREAFDWHLILNTSYSLLDTSYLILGSQYLLRAAWCLILDTWYLLLDSSKCRLVIPTESVLSTSYWKLDYWKLYKCVGSLENCFISFLYLLISCDLVIPYDSSDDDIINCQFGWFRMISKWFWMIPADLQWLISNFRSFLSLISID